MPDYKPKHPQLIFPTVSQDELADAIMAELDGTYHRYEVRDITDRIGVAIVKLLENGKSVPIRGLGKFVLMTNGEREYFDVVKKQWMLSRGSVTSKFRFTKTAREQISKRIKKLLIQTMRLQPDVPLNKPQHNVKE